MTTTRVPADSTAPIAVRPDTSAHRTSAWLGAYALGLAHTEQDDRACLQELLAAAGRSVRLLRDAQRHLRSNSVVDPDLRHRADSLLARAWAIAEQGRVRQVRARGWWER